jgi:hypothetical protein
VSDTAFGKLLGAQTTAEQRERLHRARQQLALSEGDAVWGLVQVVQDYLDSLGPDRAATPAPLSAAPAVQWVFRPWQLVTAALALQTLALSLAFCIGAHWSAAPVQGAAPWLRAVLSVPAGWIVFAHALPLLVQGAWSSWLARKQDRGVGWALLCLFVGAIACCALTLCWLLS